jgi:large subunit ribosomal protein L15
MKLSNLQPAEGSTKNKKRIGRGQGSGRGGTSTKGHKGAQSRTGYSAKTGFEGGQMPLFRRIPKFGFKNPFRVEYSAVNLDQLEAAFIKFPELSKTELTPAVLKQFGLVSSSTKPVKILGRGSLTSKVIITAHHFSETAKAAIEKAGGTATLVKTPATEA